MVNERIFSKLKKKHQPFQIQQQKNFRHHFDQTSKKFDENHLNVVKRNPTSGKNKILIERRKKIEKRCKIICTENIVFYYHTKQQQQYNYSKPLRCIIKMQTKTFKQNNLIYL